MEMCHTRNSAYNTHRKLLAYKHPLDSFLPLDQCFSQASAVNIESRSVYLLQLVIPSEIVLTICSILIALFFFNFQNDWLAVLAFGSACGYMGDCTLERTGRCPKVYYFDRCYFTENRTGKWEYINLLECMDLYNLSYFDLWVVPFQACNFEYVLVWLCFK